MSTTIPTAQAAYEAPVDFIPDVNAAKSNYAQALLGRIRHDRQELRILGVDPDAAAKWIEESVDAAIVVAQPAPATGKAATLAKLIGKNKAGKHVIRASKRHRRTPADMTALRDAMIAHVKKHPGQGAQEIRKAIGAKQSQMPTLRVLTSHAIRTKGVRRSMTYHPKGK